jgi:protein-tyrosine phosphatase
MKFKLSDHIFILCLFETLFHNIKPEFVSSLSYSINNLYILFLNIFLTFSSNVSHISHTFTCLSMYTRCIFSNIENKRSVLVHCSMGIQRSCTVVACYLIKYYKMTPGEAIKCIKSKRPIAFFWKCKFIVKNSRFL